MRARMPQDAGVLDLGSHGFGREGGAVVTYKYIRIFFSMIRLKL